MVTGDFSAANIFPSPRYPFLRIDKKIPDVQKFNAVNRLAADFSQIYFPSQKLSYLEESYQEGAFDPWGRPSRYAPFLHAIYSRSLCKLDYGPASLLHMFIQIFLFLLSFYSAFKILKLKQGAAIWLLLVNFCLFLTPVGISFLERGQLSLYVSLSYLWLMLGIIKKNIFYIIFSALFSYFKLTSFPLIFTVFILFLFNSKNIVELKQNIIFLAIFLSTIIFLFLTDIKLGILFARGLLTQEFTHEAMGISIFRILPRIFSKRLPLILILLGYLNMKSHKKSFMFFVPYLIGCGMILTLYPTVAFDYRVPSLFCFIPLIVYWSEERMIYNSFLRCFLKYFFGIFLIVVSFSAQINELFHSPLSIIWIYIVSALIFMSSSIFSPMSK